MIESEIKVVSLSLSRLQFVFRFLDFRYKYVYMDNRFIGTASPLLYLQFAVPFDSRCIVCGVFFFLRGRVSKRFVTVSVFTAMTIGTVIQESKYGVFDISKMLNTESMPDKKVICDVLQLVLLIIKFTDI